MIEIDGKKEKERYNIMKKVSLESMIKREREVKKDKK